MSFVFGENFGKYSENSVQFIGRDYCNEKSEIKSRTNLIKTVLKFFNINIIPYKNALSTF